MWTSCIFCLLVGSQWKTQTAVACSPSRPTLIAFPSFSAFLGFPFFWQGGPGEKQSARRIIGDAGFEGEKRAYRPRFNRTDAEARNPWDAVFRHWFFLFLFSTPLRWTARVLSDALGSRALGSSQPRPNWAFLALDRDLASAHVPERAIVAPRFVKPRRIIRDRWKEAPTTHASLSFHWLIQVVR